MLKIVTSNLILCLATCILLSCQPKRGPEETSVDVDKLELTGKILIYGPDVDATTCEVFGQCDCCAGHYVFINESEFIAIDYCEADQTYRMGTYKTNNNIVSLHVKELVVDRTANWPAEGDESGMEEMSYTLTERKVDPITITLTLQQCEKNILFEVDSQETPFAAVDKNTLFSDVVDRMKQHGVWPLLGLKE
ncbi:MAG: hypothetical protein KF725_13345 [Cyclobacteriaceae bacterium]|nr:hypothetical protein [Cyclobacteriaceae bacterium]UYN85393.1 MAG: hypothetical protein KIT51_10870 [Cyclobacteriaceae bacterium]